MEGTMKKIRFSEKGQALILIVFGVVALVAFTGLAVDGGAALMDRREAQNAADAAALAAARTKIRVETGEISVPSGTVTQDNLNSAASYAVSFFNLDGASTEVYWPPKDGPYADDDEYIQVIITTHTQAYFSPIIGQDEIDGTVQAVSRAKSGVIKPFYDGNGLVALAPSGSQTCMFNSNAHLYVMGAGMLCNSNNSQAFWMDSNVHLEADAGYHLVGGGYHTKNNVEVTGPIQTNYPAETYPPDLSMIPDPPSPPVCASNGSKSGSTYYPGNWSGITIDSNNTVTFTSGVYCINNYFNINSNVDVTGGDVTFVLNNVNMTFSSNVDTVFNSLEIYTTNGNFTMNSNSTTDAGLFRFYATGNGIVDINSNAQFTSDDAFIYIPHGQPVLNSNGTIQITAPTSGPYAGLAYYLPMSNTNQVIINSNASLSITGTYLAPAVRLQINSNGSAQSMDSQIIVYTVRMDSNGYLILNYDASKLYGGASDPIIELVQ
jgi:uncharacterized membrane protein